jgi:CheY-like chemotaxis protein
MKMRIKRILLAEDNPNDVKLALHALKKRNILNEVDVVTDGAEVLDYLYCRGQYEGRDGGNPVVILLDLKMPKVDGIQVLREIKSSDELMMIPVVVLTSSREDRDIIESYRLGTNAYIVKPVDFDEFAEAVSILGQFWVLLNEAPPQYAE